MTSTKINIDSSSRFKQQPKYNLTAGDVFDGLTVVVVNGCWAICQCVCGKRITTRAALLVRGVKTSCGCLHKKRLKETLIARNTTHGKSNTPEYAAWKLMKARCQFPSVQNYKRYGGRGIKVCNRWVDSFDNFLEDMGIKPSGHSLDRIDCNGDYTPENCRWATTTEQANNRRSSRFLDVNGKRMTVAEWARALNIPVQTLHSRLKRDAAEVALVKPYRPRVNNLVITVDAKSIS